MGFLYIFLINDEFDRLLQGADCGFHRGPIADLDKSV